MRAEFPHVPKRIICATDLTARSAPALQRAASLSRQTGARLLMLHVIDSRQADRVARMQSNRAYVQLLAEADRLFGSSADLIDVAVRRGKVRDTIASAAAEWDADLIVVAAPQPGRGSAILGTTAERLVRTARRSVLVVHRTMESHYGKVVIASDLSTAALPMVRTAVRLAALDQASATMVHAIHSPHSGMMKSAGLDESVIADFERTSLDRARLQLQSIGRDAGLIPHARAIVTGAPPANAILEVLERERPDLLAIGASRWFLLKRLLVGSVADR
ncbi:MAG TPA: universal stress protein, partial [Povalibacter sp.]|uniref:universal stress protein n=1 Tax=Povalibacter sp. TaxID=1962978 RepID=UPI002CB6EB38